MESTIQFREESLEVKGETGPGMSVRQHGESRVELGRVVRIIRMFQAHAGIEHFRVDWNNNPLTGTIIPSTLC